MQTVDGPMLLLESKNYGDRVSQYLIEELFNIKIQGLRHLPTAKNYVTMGSICFLVNPHSVVWGAGYGAVMRASQIVRPAHVCCVRGPLTRKTMLENNIECPPIYGDPALLLPLLHYYPDITPRYKWGFIPHYIDQKLPLVNSVKASEDYLFIDILSGDRPEYLLKAIAECEVIIASSLHGLVIAAAYKKPCVWIKMSENINGGTLKYRDFYSSFGYDCAGKRLDLTDVKSVDQLDAKILHAMEIRLGNDQLYERGVDLLKSSPFVTNAVQLDTLLTKWKEYC